MSSEFTLLGDRAERTLQQRRERQVPAAFPALREWVQGLVRAVREPVRRAVWWSARAVPSAASPPCAPGPARPGSAGGNWSP